MRSKFTNYKITNLINGKVYIGYHEMIGSDRYFCSSSNNHFWNEVRKYEEGCKGLSIRDIKKLYKSSDFKNFKREIIQYYEDSASMKEGEKYWIRFYRDLLGAENVYNISAGGEGGDPYESIKYTDPEEYRRLSRKKFDKGQSTLGPEGRRKARIRINKSALDSGKHVMLRMNEILGAEGLSNRSRKSIETMRENGTLSEKSKRNYQKKLEELGIHPMNKKLLELKESDPDQYKKYQHERMLLVAKRRNENGTMKEKWVYYNPVSGIYLVRSYNWPSRMKKGFTNRLCRLKDWSSYSTENGINPSIIS